MCETHLSIFINDAFVDRCPKKVLHRLCQKRTRGGMQAIYNELLFSLDFVFIA